MTQLPSPPKDKKELAIYNTLKKLYSHKTETEHTFPSSMSSAERRLVHAWAVRFNLHSESFGEGSERCVKVSKKNPNTEVVSLTISSMSKTLRKRFVKDFALPIMILDSPHWEYYMQMYNDLFDLKPKLDALLNAVHQCGGEKAFLNRSEELQAKVIDSIKQSQSYSDFSTDMKLAAKFTVSSNFSNLQKKVLYTPVNHGKTFISIDLKQANFNAIYAYAPDLLSGHTSWESFIKSFTNLDYFAISKKFRQYVLSFEVLNKRHESFIYPYLLDQVFTHMMKEAKHRNMDIKESSLFLVPSSDELVIETSTKQLNEYLSFLNSIATPIMNIQAYRLILVDYYQQPKSKARHFFQRQVYNSSGSKPKIVYKCVPPEYFAMCVKFCSNMGITAMDKQFLKDGEIVEHEETEHKFEVHS